MQELSLNILDIAQNSVRAKASLVTITMEEDTVEKTLRLSVADNGCGMTEEQVAHAMDPFFTTRTTRKVGLGISFFKLTAEATGGSFSIDSTLGVGTTTTAFYHTGHIDMMPVGDMVSTMVTLISMNPKMDFVYRHTLDGREFVLDTREIKAVLEDVPIDSPEVVLFIRDSLTEGEEELKNPETVNL